MTAGVQVVGVSRRFGSTEAISDVTFDVEQGEVLGLLGPNGAGKTTTMRVMTGYLRPTTGRVVVGGVDMAVDPVAARQHIGYMPESSAVPAEMTVIAFLRYCARLRRVPRADRQKPVAAALRQAGLGGMADARIGTLSKGYRQRVALAQALVHDPDVLVLDKGRVLAISDVAALTAATGTRLELRVSGDPTRVVQIVTGMLGVDEASVRGELVVVKGTGTDLGQRVAAAIVDAGIGLLEQRVASSGTLEEAYLNLVRE